ncbi:MAG: hypothetical protein ACRD3M_18780 [Thermoanaerobaculia bacterium]
MDETFPVEMGDIGRAKALLLTADRLSARDALHFAVMQRRGTFRIPSFDIGFDGLPGVTRVSQ